MYGLPGVISFKTAGLSEDAARLLAKADNKSELIKYLLERHARGKSAHTAHTEEGGGEGGRAGY
jgi:hypothetical protein